MFSVSRRDFGPGFIFGTATASYQVEGGHEDGRGMSIWDTFASRPGNIRDNTTGRIACDHYHRWAQDLDLLRDGGFDAYRFSFSWPRLIPEGTGAANQAGIDFYDRLIDGMLERGIQPFGTLYHWDLPSALQDRGGWMNRDVASWLADYGRLVAQKFADRLTALATINEPWCVAFLSHFIGEHAPGYRDLRATARAMHHVLLAHGTAIDALRAEGAKNLGIVLNLEKAEPGGSDAGDEAAADIGDALFNRWYLGAIFKGAYPEELTQKLAAWLPAQYERDMEVISRPLDWLGINYYTRALYIEDRSDPLFGIGRAKGSRPANDRGWEIYPEGLTELLIRVSREYTKLPLYVTENGTSEEDDSRRIDFYEQHLRAVLNAQRQGADVRGYFAWSLIDNWEWAFGFTSRFGIVHVDFATQRRTPKGSYRAFQGMLHNTR
jgi:beta-glucosidase